MDRTKLIKATALSAHKKLCDGYRERGKAYIKKTKDTSWIQLHNTDEIDLCSAKLDELPEDWLSERIAGSEIAVDAVLDAIKHKRSLDAELVEEVAESLHRRWLERNAERASDVQKFDYSALPEVEKIKDRHFIKSAIEIFESGS